MTEYPNDDNRPPLFKSWHAWYLFVVLFLIAQIILFYYLTKLYS